MTEQSEPRVTVILPGGQPAEARMNARRQDDTGRWWYRVTLDVPADAVRPIDGEDYSKVPTERPPSRGWVLQAMPSDTPGQRAVILHCKDCWAAQGRLEEVDQQQARIFLREGWATACDACTPAPSSDG